MGKIDQIISANDSWEEGKHPRAEDGKFGSGGGSAAASGGPQYRFAGQPPEPSSKPTSNEGYGSAGAGKHGERLQHAWEKEPRSGDTPIKRPPEASKAPAPATKPAGPSAASGGKSKAPFVNDFMKGSKSREEDMSRLSRLPDDHLRKALDLITSHRLTDEDSVYMKELLR